MPELHRLSRGAQEMGKRAPIALRVNPHVEAGEPRVMPYKTIPGAITSADYTLSVNGQAIFVEKFGEVSIARFAFSGRADISLNVSGAIVNPRISPRGHAFLPQGLAEQRSEAHRDQQGAAGMILHLPRNGLVGILRFGSSHFTSAVAACAPIAWLRTSWPRPCAASCRWPRARSAS